MYAIRNRLLIIILLSIIVVPIKSQIGIKGGPALSDIIFTVEGQIPYLGYGTNSLKSKIPNLTFQFGVFKTFKLSNKLEFQPEILYVKKGLNYSANYIYDDISYLIKIHYLEVPLLLKYNLFNIGKNQLSVLFGPYASYAFKNIRIIETDNSKIKEKMPNIRNFDLGVTVSLSYNFSLYNKKLVIDLRTSYGLVNILDFEERFIPQYYAPTDDLARNVYNVFTLGYFINIGD